MNQFEYEQQMNELNAACNAETEQLRSQLHQIGQKQCETKKQINELKAKSMALGIEFQRICEEIRVIKQRYTDQKHLLWVDRPTKGVTT